MAQSKWRYLFNIDTIGYICVFCIVIYTWYKNRNKPLVLSYTGDKYAWNPNVNTQSDSDVLIKEVPKRPKFNKHEERCRDIFQEIYGREFLSVRPKWLKNPVTGKNLELDGFCPSIKTFMGTGLAFEYDGAQHSQYNKHFHRNNPKEFEYQVKKDSYKDMRCKQEGVALVRIPHYVAFQDLERFIKNKLRKMKLLENYHTDDPRFLEGLYTR